MTRKFTKVRIIPGERGIGERFFAADYVTTPFTLTLDDDRSLSCSGVHKLLLAARQFPGRIVTSRGFRRSIYECSSGSHALYYDSDKNDNNIALTSLALMPTSLLKDYKNFMPRSVIDVVNRERNCEDIAMNWLAAHLNDDKVSGVFVDGLEICNGHEGRESLKKRNSEGRRDACLNFLRAILPEWPVPRPSSLSVQWV
ncbi:unnamed protein product [Vitrella brassicaformis CCMP3155]|uniref:Glycosyl transferase 64 domain-containing protein n=2 Tax=Vitrella brassicaformis TaxID=1169539 RepID=A0A0G4GT07_VITBC|nr:unnamed protein product [Vitrella brassicaformis CCMP3155]|eukprot:CEM33854.1 unnamed protein product [Vitrella brassicaformis CCMP3155]